MSHLLQLKTSLFDSDDTAGVSTLLSNELIQALVTVRPETSVQIRDFSKQPIPYLDSARLSALTTPEQERTSEQQASVSFADELIAQLQGADVLVIGAPMYNFSIPAMLKSWVDHVARAGTTFKYTEKGAVGLLGDKKVYVVLATGGLHQEGVTDHARPYLRTVLGFLGLSDIEIVVADGLNMGEEPRQRGLSAARKQIEALIADRVKT